MEDGMYTRSVKAHALKSIKYFPVLAILGPRQCGKTTLAKEIMIDYPSAVYLDMERPSDVRKLEDPELFFNVHSGRLIIIDEIQHRGELFPVIRSFVDQTQRKSPIIVTGSASMDLIRQGGETLAGRITFIDLTPLTVMEVGDIEIIKQWLYGGFPGSLMAPDSELSMEWREQYIRTFVERDLPMLGLKIPAISLQRLLLLMADHHGGIINLSKIGELFGVSHTQMRSYIDFFSGSFLIRVLHPCEPNLKKQLVKTPKIYYRDSGLLHTVLNIEKTDTLLGSTILGESWEGFVIEQVLSSISSRWKASFFRTHKGAELDLVLELGMVRIGIECKSHTAPVVTKGFWIAIDDLQIKPGNRWIVCPIDEQYSYKEGAVIGGVRQVIDFINGVQMG
jgi:predicted AAA+ superfamily ATPase